MRSLCTLDSSTFGERLAKQALARVHQPANVRLARNETLYTCGQSDDNLYIVTDGWVKSTMVTSCGKSCLLDIYSDSDVIGESCLHGGMRHETVTAMTDTELVKIPRTTFLDVIGADHLTSDCLRYFALRMAEQQDRITQLITSCCEKRLATILLHLAARIGHRQAGRIHLKQRISQQELSEMVGTTRSRVGFFMQRFRAFGLISHVPDTFLVIDEQRINTYLADDA